MKLFRGLALLVVGAACGAALGYNYGRGAPLFSNPLVKLNPSEKISRDARELYNDTKERIRKAAQ